MTEKKKKKKARKYAQPYFDEAFKHTTPFRQFVSMKVNIL